LLQPLPKPPRPTAPRSSHRPGPKLLLGSWDLWRGPSLPPSEEELELIARCVQTRWRTRRYVLIFAGSRLQLLFHSC